MIPSVRSGGVAHHERCVVRPVLVVWSCVPRAQFVVVEAKAGIVCTLEKRTPALRSRMIDLGTLAGLHEHRHELDTYCPRCDRSLTRIRLSVLRAGRLLEMFDAASQVTHGTDPCKKNPGSCRGSSSTC